MLVSRSKTFLAAWVALLIGISCAQAEEWLYFNPIRGELSLSVDGRWTDYEPGGSSRTTDFEERLRLNFSGYSLDPRIFTFNISLEPTFEQDKIDSDAVTVRTDSTLLNYAVGLRALHGVPTSPISLSADLSATSEDRDGTLGSRSDITTESRSASAHWKFRPFRSTLTYRERYSDEIIIPGFGLLPRLREDLQRTVTYRGKSKKMELLLEDIELDDRTADDQDYESQQARLTNYFHWGKKSSLNSRLEYFNREGFNAQERISVDESLRLQHRSNLWTAYRYNYDSMQRTTDTETHRGSAELNHSLYENLTTRLRVSGSTTQADVFEQDTYDANLDFNYRKQVTPDLRISANLGGGYNHNERTGGQLDFTETLPVLSLGSPVVLTQRYILWPTIVVTSPGCGLTPCVEGPDYIVQDAGGDFTQLFIQVGGSINAGDTITVDYAYAPPTAEFYGIPYRVGVRVDYRSFAFYHRTNGENQTYVSGPDPGAVGDRRIDTTGIQWNWSRGRNRASLGASRVYTETIGRETTEYFLDQSLNYVIAPAAILNASLGQSFLRDGTASDTYTGDLSVRWYPYPGTSVTPRLSAFYRELDPGSTDSYVKAGVDVRWMWRRLAADLSYDHAEFDNAGTNRVEDRVFMKLTRKF